MKIFRSIGCFLGLISFWISIFILFPIGIYLLCWGVGVIKILEVSITIGSSLGVISRLYQTITEFNVFFWFQTVILILLLSYYFWIKSYRYWKFIMTLTIGLFATIIIMIFGSGHYEVLSFITKPYTQNLDLIFKVSGYRENIPKSQNSYYLQNQWLENNYGVLKGMSGDIDAIKKDLQETVELSYSKTQYSDPAIPPMSWDGKGWTDYIWENGDIETQILRYKFVRKRMESFVPSIEFLLSDIVQKDIFSRWNKELSEMTQKEKLNIKKSLQEYPVDSIYKDIVIKEYYIVKNFSIDEITRLMERDNLSIPKCLYDPEQTKYILARYMSYLLLDKSYSDQELSFSNYYGKEYLGYNFIGRKLLDGMIPRIFIYNRILELELQRKNLFKNL